MDAAMTINHLAVQVPEILLPKTGIDLSKWAVIACDQFTSQPEYWRRVADYVDTSPSTLHMILPEVYLGGNDEEVLIQYSTITMKNYLETGLFQQVNGMIYVERTIGDRIRHGLMICLDLEAYDFSKNSNSLIRASEGTILERIPPRVRIRQDAMLEIPHILVLYDDPEDSVLLPVKENLQQMDLCYDFDLMMESGSLSGWLVNDPRLTSGVLTALDQLADPQLFCEKYDLPADTSPLLFAVGDGNHSLATAKTIWEQIKDMVGMDHPARYALVEIENLHDPALVFEPIHRVLFNCPKNINSLLRDFFGQDVEVTGIDNLDDLTSEVDQNDQPGQVFGLLGSDGYFLGRVSNPKSNLPVGTLQAFLDDLLSVNAGARIDYIHGTDVLDKLAQQPGTTGFYLPALAKDEFFKTVIKDGALPRKTFSMGEAREKRFYMECRKIK
jgi:uncharacterized protein (DUF1015 family)